MRAGIGFGSNLGDRQANLRRARNYLRALPCVTGVCGSAPLYETSPVGCDVSAKDFLNTVVEVNLAEGTVPTHLLEKLRGIETALGRPSRYPKNASRPIDLDILYFGDETLDSPQLTLPHPRLCQRRFVLTPLADLRPELILPGRDQPVRELLHTLDDPAAVRLVSLNW